MCPRVNRPKQQRSEQTLARILEATEDLLYERGLPDVPVREICDASGASSSSFYARFPDKSSLLRAVMDRFCDRVMERIDELAAEQVADERFEAFVLRCLDALVLLFRRERRLFQAITLAGEDDPSLASQRQWLDREILRRFIDLASQRYPERERAFLEARVQEGIPIIASAFRGGIEGPQHLGLEDGDAHDRVVADLTALILRFVDGSG